MKIRTNVRAGGSHLQHNEALAVRSNVRAGGAFPQHNEALASLPHLSGHPQ